MLIQEAPADTLNYMVFGFAVIIASMGLYVLSLVNRHRNLQREMELLDEVGAKGQRPVERA